MLVAVSLCRSVDVIWLLMMPLWSSNLPSVSSDGWYMRTCILPYELDSSEFRI